MPPAGVPIRPQQPIPAPAETGGWDIYGEIRAALGTPLINSLWPGLAGQGLLEEAWRALAPQAEPARPEAGALTRRASQAAREVAWPAVASPAALEAAGIGDARAGMAAILDCYLAALPRFSR